MAAPPLKKWFDNLSVTMAQFRAEKKI